MSSLFSGLESLGLGKFSEAKLFESEKEKEKKKEGPKVPEVKESDLIFDKSFTCPVCSGEFKAKQMRTGKVKLIGSDQDLRPRYQNVDSLKYDAILCPKCGYAALSRFFSYMTGAQAKLIRENISENFQGLEEDTEIMTYDGAITRHKMALVNAMVKHAKSSEKAYTCLKLAWILRGKSETLPPDTPNIAEVKKQLLEEEKECLSNAYEGFVEAFPKESFPMCGMDEMTVTYLSAALAKQIGRYDDSLKLLARVITAKAVNEHIKESAREMKDQIRVEMEKGK